MYQAIVTIYVQAQTEDDCNEAADGIAETAKYMGHVVDVDVTRADVPATNPNIQRT